MDACDSREQRDLGGEVIQALLEHVQSGDGLIKPLIHLRSTDSSYWEVITGSRTLQRSTCLWYLCEVEVSINKFLVCER